MVQLTGNFRLRGGYGVLLVLYPPFHQSFDAAYNFISGWFSCQNMAENIRMKIPVGGVVGGPLKRPACYADEVSNL